MRTTEIYLYGMTVVTTSHRLADDFPTPDTYCEIAESHRAPGGETGTCAVVLDSLGLAVQLDGNYQGYNTYPDLESYFASTAVSLELITRDPDFEGLEDIVFVDRETRTCFGRFCAFHADTSRRRWNSPSDDAIGRAQGAGIDPFFEEESVEAARLCHQHGVKYATIDCPMDSDVHALSDVDVLSAEFLGQRYPDQALESLFSDYVNRTNGLVIFTFGARELWYGRRDSGVHRFEPYRVDVASSLGAGDSFKAGAIFALCKGMDDPMLVRFASATAAAACASYPIAADPPDLARIAAIAGEPSWSADN